MVFCIEEDPMSENKVRLQVICSEYVFSKEELQAAVDLFSYENNPGVNNELLSGIGNKEEVKTERETFLKKKETRSLNDLLKVSCITYKNVTRNFSTMKKHPLDLVFQRNQNLERSLAGIFSVPSSTVSTTFFKARPAQAFKVNTVKIFFF